MTEHHAFITDRQTLAARLEVASPDEQREMLEAAYAAFNGGRLFDQPATPGFRETHARWDRFRRMLDAEAFESAAMMLVPEGWFTRLAMEDRHSHSWRWDLRGGYGVDASARASTPALALTAASLRARPSNAPTEPSK